MNRERGFTLIELLVVIAIIGILSSIVLASLNSARAKGADAAVKANLSNIRAQAEILYDTKNCYSNSDTCGSGSVITSCSNTNTIFANANVTQQIGAAELAGSGTAVCNTAANAAGWAASTALKSSNVINGTSGVDYWCVDSTGTSKVIDNALVAQTACP